MTYYSPYSVGLDLYLFQSSTRHSASPPSSRDGGQGHQQSKPPNFSPVELRPIRKEPYASDLSLAYGSFPQKKTRPHSIHVDSIASESSSPSSMMNPFTPEASTSFNPQRGFSQDQHVSEKGRNASEWTYGTYTAASSSSNLPPQLQVYEATNEHTLDSNNIYDSGATFDTEFFGTPLSAGRNASSLFTDPSARRKNQEQGFQDGWDGREMRTQQEQQQQFYHLLEGLGGGNRFNLEKNSGSVGMGMEIGRRDERSLHGRPNSAGPLHTPYKGTSETIHPSSDPYSSTFFYQPSEASTPASGGGGGGDSRPSTSSQRQLSAQNRRLRSATFTTASAPYGRTSSGQLLVERQGSGLSQSPSEVGGAGRRFAIDASASASGSLLVDTSMGNSTISTMSSPLTLSSSQENPSASSDSPSEMVGNLSFGGEPQQSQEQSSQTGNTKKAGKSGRSSFKLDRREKDRIGSKSRRDGEKDAMATLQTLLVGDQPSSSTNTSNSEGSSSKSTRITRAQILELATQTLQDREEQVQALKNLIRRERAQRVEEKLEWRSELEKALEENQRLRRSQLGHNSWNQR